MMNFIVKLFKFKKSITKFEYNSIMIVINKFTKKVYFVLFHEKMSAEKVAYLFKQHIVTNHKISAEIIFEKNIQFRSKF